MRRARIELVPWALAFGAALGCRDPTDPVAAREAAAARDVLRVGVVWPHLDPERDGFWPGVELALGEVNDRGGPHVIVERAADESSARSAKAVAQRWADDRSISAVLGHADPDVALVTSIQYEYSGLLFLYAGTGSRRLNREGFDRVRQLQPSAEVSAQRLAAYAANHDMARVAILLVEDTYARAFAHAFESEAEDRRVRVVARFAYRGSPSRFLLRIRQLDALQVDGVLLAARGPAVKPLLDALQRAELDPPKLGADALATVMFARMEGAEGTVLATAFHHELATEEAARFTRAYRAAYGRPPDGPAAAGYSGVQLVAGAAARGGGTSPAALLRGLEGPDPLPSALGPLRFDGRGHRQASNGVFVRVNDGGLQLVDDDDPSTEPISGAPGSAE